MKREKNWDGRKAKWGRDEWKDVTGGGRSGWQKGGGGGGGDCGARCLTRPLSEFLSGIKCDVELRAALHNHSL